MTKFKSNRERIRQATNPSASSRRRPVRKGRGWWVAALALVVLVSGFAFLLSLRPEKGTGQSRSRGDKSAMATDLSGEPASPAVWKGPLPAEVARLFTTAKDHRDRLELIANPSEDGDLMETFFLKGFGSREKVSSVTPMGPVSTDKITFERYKVSLEDGGSRLLCVIISGHGAKVDFRSYARYSTESWEDLLSGKSTVAGEVRVFIQPGSAYLQGYSDDLKWCSYIATSPDTPEPLYFYAARDSETATHLAELTAAAPMRAIRSTGESNRHRQFEITEMIAAGWVR